MVHTYIPTMHSGYGIISSFLSDSWRLGTLASGKAGLTARWGISVARFMHRLRQNSTFKPQTATAAIQGAAARHVSPVCHILPHPVGCGPRLPQDNQTALPSFCPS